MKVLTVILAALFIPVLSSCESHESCVSIATRYRDAVPDAKACTASDPMACSVGRPMVMAEQGEDGSVKVEGLCRAPCHGAYSPGTTAVLDAIVADYDDADCAYYACFCFGDMPPTCTEGQCVGKVN